MQFAAYHFESNLQDPVTTSAQSGSKPIQSMLLLLLYSTATANITLCLLYLNCSLSAPGWGLLPQQVSLRPNPFTSSSKQCQSTVSE